MSLPLELFTIYGQAAAVAMKERERLEAVEAEKRLKATLTAKREPSSMASRVASPSIGSSSAETNDAKHVEANGEDVAMEGPSTAPAISPKTPEVTFYLFDLSLLNPSQGPWLPELSTMFDDIKKIAPEKAYEALG